MKKIVSVLSLVIIVFFLCACSQTPALKPSPIPSHTEETPRIAVPQVIVDAVDNAEKEIERILQYDEDGLLKEEYFYFANNINSSRPLMDSKGNAIESGKYDFSYELFKYTYDARGNLLTKIWSWENDESEYDDVLMESNTYDAYGRLIKKEAVLEYYFNPEKNIYRFDDLSYGTYYYSYDDNDNIIEEIRDFESNDQKIIYEYDGYNRCIKQVEYEYSDISSGNGEMAKICTYKYYDDNYLNECKVEYYDNYSLLLQFYDGNGFQRIQAANNSDDGKYETVCEFTPHSESFKETYYYYENGSLIDQRFIYDSERAIFPDDYYFHVTILGLDDLFGRDPIDVESTEDIPSASNDVYTQYYTNGTIKAEVEYKQ